MSITVTVFLATERGSRFERVTSAADAIRRMRTGKRVQFTLAAPAELATLETIFAVTNDAIDTAEHDRAAAEYRRDGETRSVSVGDLVHVPGLGTFACDPTGWRAFDHPWVERFAVTGTVRQHLTFDTPYGETVTIPVADVDRWARERETLSNYGAAAAARNALAALTARPDAHLPA